jgi:hypothetical protein
MKALLPLLCLSIFSLASCQSDESDNEATPSTYLKDSYSDDDIGQYMMLKDALVSNNLDVAKEAASMMQIHLDPEMAEDINHSLNVLISSPDMYVARKSFFLMSEMYFEYLHHESPLDHEIYLQYCPMAFDNAGASWLSEDKAILNPYFGDEMLTCGMTTEVLHSSGVSNE